MQRSSMSLEKNNHTVTITITKTLPLMRQHTLSRQFTSKDNSSIRYLTISIWFTNAA